MKKRTAESSYEWIATKKRAQRGRFLEMVRERKVLSTTSLKDLIGKKI